MLCPICGPANAPRPSGIQTHTVNGVTHRTLECVSLATSQEQVIRTVDGYASRSGRVACDPCFHKGQPHSYQAEELPHSVESGAATKASKPSGHTGGVKGTTVGRHQRPTRTQQAVERRKHKHKHKRRKTESDKET